MRQIIPRPEHATSGFQTGWWFGVLNIGVMAVITSVFVAVRRGPLDGLIFAAWGVGVTFVGSVLFGAAVAIWRTFQGWVYDRYLGRED